jgi:hypothetical protein
MNAVEGTPRNWMIRRAAAGIFNIFVNEGRRTLRLWIPSAKHIVGDGCIVHSLGLILLVVTSVQAVVP